MHAHHVNYLKRDAADGRRYRGQLVNVGFFLHGVPRLMPLCRLLGHRPVVDGTGQWKTNGDGERYGNPSRWVVCDRCGLRGEPQGQLDADRWNIGDRYDGQYAPLLPRGRHVTVGVDRAADGRPTYPPGRIPSSGDGALGGQLVIGRPHRTFGFDWKVGNPGSEHTLAASLHLWPLGSLYLHTEEFGRGIQRRLNNRGGYHSRVIGLELTDGRLSWKLWAKRDEWSRSDPWWQRGDLNLRVRDHLFGPRRYSYTDVPGGTTTRIVRMPESDYLVELTLRRQTLGRKRWPWKRRSFTVRWETPGEGIPFRRRPSWKGAGICSSSVAVDERSVRAGTWPDSAATAIAAKLTANRTREEWSPVGLLPLDPDTDAVVRPANRVTAEV